MALLAGMTFVACSSDDDNGSVNSNCVPCAFEAASEVCEGDNGNAFVSGIDTQQNFDEFVAAFCEEDNNPSDNCVTCAAYEIQGQTIPSTEVCEGENGNAYVNGMDTTMSYDSYIQAQEMLTTCE